MLWPKRTSLIEGTGRIDEWTVPDVSPHPRSRKFLGCNLLRLKAVPFVSGTEKRLSRINVREIGSRHLTWPLTPYLARHEPAGGWPAGASTPRRCRRHEDRDILPPPPGASMAGSKSREREQGPASHRNLGLLGRDRWSYSVETKAHPPRETLPFRSHIVYSARFR